jgi:allantoinase
MMSVGMHMCLLDHPARAAVLARFLDHVSRHDKVWALTSPGLARA